MKMQRFASVRVLGIALAATAAGGCASSPAPGRAGAAAAPDTVEFPSGGLTLRGLVYRPAQSGRRPAVLFLHGSGGDYDQAVAAAGPLYASHGYVLFVPFRRGQGLSAGRGEAILTALDRESAANGPEGRGRLLARLLETEQMDDVRAALAYLRRRPDVDTGRVAVAGNSFGGILSVFSAAWADGIRAAVASAPAAQTWARLAPVRERMLAAAREARVPVFFFQAENDYDLAPSRSLPEAMAAAGKPYRVKIYPPYGTTVEQAHSFGYFGGATYGPDVFAFLDDALGRR